MRFQENKMEVLAFYLALKFNPELTKSDLIHRVYNYDPLEEGMKYADINRPMTSRSMHMKDLINSINLDGLKEDY